MLIFTKTFSVVNFTCIQNDKFLLIMPSIITHTHANFIEGSKLVKLILTLIIKFCCRHMARKPSLALLSFHVAHGSLF